MTLPAGRCWSTLTGDVSDEHCWWGLLPRSVVCGAWWRGPRLNVHEIHLFISFPTLPEAWPEVVAQPYAGQHQDLHVSMLGKNEGGTMWHMEENAQTYRHIRSYKGNRINRSNRINFVFTWTIAHLTSPPTFTFASAQALRTPRACLK